MPAHTQPESDKESDADDLDDLLDETGEIVNRSNGKTGTYTTAEPDKNKDKNKKPD